MYLERSGIPPDTIFVVYKRRQHVLVQANREALSIVQVQTFYKSRLDQIAESNVLQKQYSIK